MTRYANKYWSKLAFSEEFWKAILTSRHLVMLILYCLCTIAQHLQLVNSFLCQASGPRSIMIWTVVSATFSHFWIFFSIKLLMSTPQDNGFTCHWPVLFSFWMVRQQQLSAVSSPLLLRLLLQYNHVSFRSLLKIGSTKFNPSFEIDGAIFCEGSSLRESFRGPVWPRAGQI